MTTDIQGTADDAERRSGQDDAKPQHQADGRADAEWRWNARFQSTSSGSSYA